MTAALAETLAILADAAKGCEDDWWVIGSAAVVLHGGQLADLKDVDVMMSPRDAHAVLGRLGAQRGGAEASAQFHSSVFGVCEATPVPIEVFGGFTLAANGTWREVCFCTREPVRVGGATVYVPSAEELVALLRSFGRTKDLERTKLLRL